METWGYPGAHLYDVCCVQGACARTTKNTCWKCERMVVGQKGLLPGSWNTMVTMSLPM